MLLNEYSAAARDYVRFTAVWRCSGKVHFYVIKLHLNLGRFEFLS